MTEIDKKTKKPVRDFIRTVVIAVGIAAVFRSLLFEPFNIPSGSMIPTLKVGDYLFVSKYAYGYSRYSFPFALIPFDGRVLAGEPERGDVVVFRRPGEESVDFIKRLVGIPGDTVQMIDGRLYLNGVVVRRERLGESQDEGRFPSRSATQYREVFADGTSHIIQEFSDSDRMDNTPPRRVPEGHYFFMGDNRDNSRDSRAGIGFVPRENLVGRAEMVFFSHNGTAAFWQVWRWPGAIRFGRIGGRID